MFRNAEALAPGKRQLMEAAVKLSATSRSLSAISIRELAREAGLNPNTFYRHFKNFDELGLAIVEQMVVDIRQPLRELRLKAAEAVIPMSEAVVSWKKMPELSLLRSHQVNNETVKLFFGYVAENPEAFVVGVRELHGASPVMRKALRQVMRDFSEDMADDIKTLKLLPELDAESLHILGAAISREMFQLSIDFIEQPEDKREKIVAQAQQLVTTLCVGHAVMNGYGKLFAKVDIANDFKELMSIRF